MDVRIKVFCFSSHTSISPSPTSPPNLGEVSPHAEASQKHHIYCLFRNFIKGNRYLRTTTNNIHFEGLPDPAIKESQEKQNIKFVIKDDEIRRNTESPRKV